MDEISQKVDLVCKALGVRQNKLAEMLGITPTFLSRVKNGIQKSKVVDLKLDVLLGGKGDALSNARPAPAPRRPLCCVPVVSWARAGASSFNYGDLSEQIDERVETDCRDENAYALIVEGDSLAPRFLAGDVVICAPNSEARNGDFVVARLRESGGVLFKRFKRTGRNGEIVRLESMNKDYDAVEYPADAFRFIHPVVEARMKVR